MSKTDDFEADTLFSDDDFGLDKTEANDLLDLRARFDKLAPLHRLPLAEAFIRLADENLGDLKRQELEKAEDIARAAATKCGLCELEIKADEAVVERQVVWVTPGSNQVQIREDMGERAHATCVKRVKEGGSAEAPLF